MARIIKLLLAVSGALALSACATAPTEPDTARVAERAAARWQLLVAGKISEAYAYLSPGKKALTSPEQYKASIKAGFWNSAKVDGVECSEADLCKVTVTISYSYKSKGKSTPLDVTRPLAEVWRRDAGEWWFVEVE